MIGVYVQFADSKYNYCTSINGTIESARQYFIGATLNFGDRYFGDKDNCQTPIAVDLIPDN